MDLIQDKVHNGLFTETTHTEILSLEDDDQEKRFFEILESYCDRYSCYINESSTHDIIIPSFKDDTLFLFKIMRDIMDDDDDEEEDEEEYIIFKTHIDKIIDYFSNNNLDNNKIPKELNISIEYIKNMFKMQGKAQTSINKSIIGMTNTIDKAILILEFNKTMNELNKNLSNKISEFGKIMESFNDKSIDMSIKEILNKVKGIQEWFMVERYKLDYTVKKVGMSIPSDTSERRPKLNIEELTKSIVDQNSLSKLIMQDNIYRTFYNIDYMLNRINILVVALHDQL